MSSKTVFPGCANGVVSVTVDDEIQMACLLAAGLVSGSVGITGVPDDILAPRDDFAALMKQKRMHIDIRNGAVFASKSRITNFDVNAAAYPHAVPALAATFCVGSGSSVISSAAGAYYGQGYGMHKLIDALSAIGADIHAESGIAITGGRQLFGGTASASNDAGVAMALSVAALRCETLVTILDVPDDCNEYFEKLASLGVMVQ